VLGLSVLAWALAQSVSSIRELVELASAFGSAGAIVIALFGLFTGFGGPLAAICTLLTGSIVWATGHFILEFSAPYLTALLSALAVYVVISTLERRQSGR